MTEPFWVPQQAWLVCNSLCSHLFSFPSVIFSFPACWNLLFHHHCALQDDCCCFKEASAGPSQTLGWMSSVPLALSNFSNSCLTLKTFRLSKYSSAEEITREYKIAVIMYWFICLLTQEEEWSFYVPLLSKTLSSGEMLDLLGLMLIVCSQPSFENNIFAKRNDERLSLNFLFI